MTAPSADDTRRNLIIWAALLALFLGALDALVMTAAMPTIIAELGGLHLYAWSYTTYFLARAVALPIFGKLSDMYSTRILFLFSIGLFLISSVAAGCSPSMSFLVVMRTDVDAKLVIVGKLYSEYCHEIILLEQTNMCMSSCSGILQVHRSTSKKILA